MWTENDKLIATNLNNDPEIMAFLKKVYCPDKSSVRQELEAHVLLPNEQFGQLMKALSLAELHFTTAHANIARLATKQTTTKTPIAPK